MKSLLHVLVACLVATGLAGCADDSTPSNDDPEQPGVGATDTTGGIRGVVVDQGIMPLAGATVKVLDTELTTTTDEQGLFLFTRMQPGTYTVEASHPLYDTRQSSAVVEAGVEKPDLVRMQLSRVIFAEPTWETQTFQGYISCSANILVPEFGGFLSEECGEGVGSPETTCSLPEALVGTCFGLPAVNNPILPGERIGKASDNKAQIDFYIMPNATTLLAEAYWTPSLSVSASPTGQKGTFNMGIYTDFLCDPFCHWNQQIDRADGGSPLYLRSDTDDDQDYSNDVALADLGYNATTRFSTFTWAGAGETGVLLEQPFDVFVTASYYLPLPEQWSVADGVAPF